MRCQDYLRDFGVHGSYAGAPAAQLLADRDQSVGIRFQAVFLPAAWISSASLLLLQKGVVGALLAVTVKP